MFKKKSENLQPTNDQKIQRLQKRLDYKMGWFNQKIQHYQDRMKTYTEAKLRQIEICQQALGTASLPKSKIS